MKKRHILFTGGGTLGHIAPLLAVLEACQEAAKQEEIELTCSYIGQATDLKEPLIKDSALKFTSYEITAGKFHRYLNPDQFRQIKLFFQGLGMARKLVAELRPDVIFAKGGYVTVPVVWVAWRQKIPVYCHESDAVAGLANRLVMCFARKIFTTWPARVYKGLPLTKIMVTGQPIRPLFYERVMSLPVLDGKMLNPSLPVITVFGGSQGARCINTLVNESWEKLLKSMQIVHITGEKEFSTYAAKEKELSGEQKKRLFVFPYLQDELPALFQKSNVVVGRAGGSTAELAASRACVILLPLSTAAQNHQWANARILEEAGAAITLDEQQTSSTELIDTINRLLANPSETTGLRAAIGSFDHPDAATKMAVELLAS